MTNLLTIVFLIIRIVSNPIANVFQKKIPTEVSSFVINFYTYLILSLLCIPLLPKCLDSSFMDFKFFSLTFLAGFLCTMGIVCIIKAIHIGELSVVGPINSYKSVVGLIAAFLFLGEIPTLIALLGIFLIIWGSKYIFETTSEGFTINVFKRKDIQLRFLALILTGTEAAILKKIILISSVEACYIFWCFMGLFWSFVFVILLKKNLLVKLKNFIPYVLIISLNLGLMEYSTNYVFSKMNVGYALALFQLSSIVTVVFGYKFFKEQNLIKKLIGSLIMIIGSVLIILN